MTSSSTLWPRLMQALADANWKPESYEDQIRSGVLIGSGIGGLMGIRRGGAYPREKGPRGSARSLFRAG